jgi:hypothetical protein
MKPRIATLLVFGGWFLMALPQSTWAQSASLELRQEYSNFVVFHLENTQKAYLEASYNPASRRNNYEFGVALVLEDTTGQPIPRGTNVTLHTAYYDGYPDYKTRFVLILSGLSLEDSFDEQLLTFGYDSTQTTKRWTHIHDKEQGLTGLAFYMIETELQTMTEPSKRKPTLMIGPYRMTFPEENRQVYGDFVESRY